MNKEQKAWVESLLVAYVDGELDPVQAAKAEAAIRDDPEAAAIAGVLRRSAAAVKSAFDVPLDQPVPERLLAAVGAVPEAKVVPFPTRRRAAAPWLLPLAASIAALAVGFGAGYLRYGGKEAGFYAAGGGPAGSGFEEALYGALEAGVAAAPVAYGDPPAGSVVVLGELSSEVAATCREFRHERQEGGGRLVELGVACRSAGGDWALLTLPGDAVP